MGDLGILGYFAIMGGSKIKLSIGELLLYK